MAIIEQDEKEPDIDELDISESDFEETEADEPVIDEADFEETEADEPVIDEADFEEPEADEPVIDEAGFEGSEQDEPVIDEAGFEGSEADDAGFEKPITKVKTTYPRPKKPKRSGLLTPRDIIVISAIMLIILIATVAAYNYFSYEDFYIADYLQVKYDGFDGKGSADISLKSPPVYDTFLKLVTLSDDGADGSLSNGDVINVSFSYDPADAKENGLRIKDSAGQITVEGLPEGVVLGDAEIFEGLSLDISGISPEISVKVSNSSEKEFFSDITYEITDDPEGTKLYACGDTYTVRATVPVDAAAELNYDISPDGIYEKDYEIPQGETYLRDASLITEEIVDELDRHALTLFGDATEYGLRIFGEANIIPNLANGSNTYKWVNPSLLSAYFTTVSEDKFGLMEYHNNDVKLVYKATLRQADGVSCSAEVVVQYTNITLSPDGRLNLQKDSGKITAASYRDANIAKIARSSTDEAYTAHKLR